ncbi:hypothetical protein [Actinomadura oligospora]|uniref:hypothetical protein n=1 Tax=Actinomadura oligospora TaxID=111804 RepID=UPI00047CAEC6|nr:hypothetical protein [Actinomadura oligospora]
MKIEPYTGFTAPPGPLGAWTDIPEQETVPFVYNGTACDVYRTDLVDEGVSIRGGLWQISKFGFPRTYWFQVRLAPSGKFWAGPNGWNWEVSDDMSGTLETVIRYLEG